MAYKPQITELRMRFLLYITIQIYIYGGTWCDVIPGHPVQSQKLDLMILMGSFQLSILYDSMILYFIPQILFSYSYGTEKI